jgi:hypothetical protein
VKGRRSVLTFATAVAVLAGHIACPAETVKSVTIPVDEIGKCGLKPDTVSRMLALDANAFDQSFDGFRSLGFRQCYVDAALIIDLYLSVNLEKLAPSSQVALKFHAGQMYAHSGEALYSIAARRMRESTENSSHPSWHAYVAATVAYLKRDLTRLKLQRGVLAATADPNDLNLAVVDRLIKCFDKPYAEAYSPQLCPSAAPPPNKSLERTREDKVPSSDRSARAAQLNR